MFSGFGRKTGGPPRPQLSAPTRSIAVAEVAYEALDIPAALGEQVGEYLPYRPSRLIFNDAGEHPTALVESIAMGSVAAPRPTYHPLLPRFAVENRVLSAAQLETVVYAGQSHNEWIASAAAKDPDGNGGIQQVRKGYFLGDGTGAGKGRQIAAVVLDNWLRGRRKGDDGGAPPVDPAKVAAKAQGLTGVLADELSMARRDVLALHVASDPGMALDLAIFALAEKAIGHHGDTGTSLAVNRRNDPLAKNGLPDSAAGGALAEIRKSLDTSWSEHSTVAARFDAFRLLDDDCRANWLAVCMASSIEASLGGQGIGRHNAFHDHLGQLLEIDVASWWRPSAGGYFARVRKAGMQRTLDAIGGPVLAARYASSKSAEMADACEKLCDGSAITEPEIRDAGLAWVPTAMRFDAGAAAEPADDDGGKIGEAIADDGEADTAGEDEGDAGIAATEQPEPLNAAA